MTPLHLAKEANLSKLKWQTDTCKYLIEIGADDAVLDVKFVCFFSIIHINIISDVFFLLYYKLFIFYDLF